MTAPSGTGPSETGPSGTGPSGPGPSGTAPAGPYVPRREEEAAIRQQVEKVRTDGKSRAVVLHGTGGAGKTMLVRSLATRPGPEGTRVVWVKPIDVDDSEYWLLSNLETAVADALDPDRAYFGPYFDHLGRVARFAHEHISYETVLAQLSRINRTFVDCYRTFARTSATTVVVTLDTIEAIRSMYLLLTLTQWMKELPQTLFVLSGRPPGDQETDPLRDELRDPHRPLEFVEVELRGFADDEARRFLSSSALHESLSVRERERLIDLTSRQPLWLALAVEYLQGADLPVEMTAARDPSEVTRRDFRRRLGRPRPTSRRHRLERGLDAAAASSLGPRPRQRPLRHAARRAGRGTGAAGYSPARPRQHVAPRAVATRRGDLLRAHVGTG